MKQNVHPLHSGVPDLVEPVRGWALMAAWFAAAWVVVFLIVGAWTVGTKVTSVFVHLVAPTVQSPSIDCER